MLGIFFAISLYSNFQKSATLNSNIHQLMSFAITSTVSNYEKYHFITSIPIFLLYTCENDCRDSACNSLYSSVFNQGSTHMKHDHATSVDIVNEFVTTRLFYSFFSREQHHQLYLTARIKDIIRHVYCTYRRCHVADKCFNIC